MANKGTPYERQICKSLSTWWSYGHTDFVFWRTSQSGGRATTRRKKGGDTKGHEGDICAVDGLGVPFLKMFAVEIKRGYSKFTPFDVLDANSKVSQEFEKWVDQVVKVQESSKAKSWLIISRRDKRTSVVAMPLATWRDDLQQFFPKTYIVLQPSGGRPHPINQYRIIVFKYDEFMETVKPSEINATLKRLK